MHRIDNRITIPEKLVIKRLFLPCLSIKEDAIVVPARKLKSSSMKHLSQLLNQIFPLNPWTKQQNKLTEDIWCPNESTGCNIRCNSNTAEHRCRIIYYGINSSQLLEQEKRCTNTDDCRRQICNMLRLAIERNEEQKQIKVLELIIYKHSSVSL